MLQIKWMYSKATIKNIWQNQNNNNKKRNKQLQSSKPDCLKNRFPKVWVRVAFDLGLHFALDATLYLNVKSEILPKIKHFLSALLQHFPLKTLYSPALRSLSIINDTSYPCTLILHVHFENKMCPADY